MPKTFFSILILLFFTNYTSSRAQNTAAALPLSEPIKIDGKLSESVWQTASEIKDFTQTEPFQNTPPHQSTEVRIAYDNAAIYVAATMYDAHPDSIFKVLSVRDADNVNADRFYISLDTYHDKQNAFIFGVTAAGVQIDDKVNTSVFDAVWQSAVSIDDKGWTVEFRIPYSAIRFPSTSTPQTWGFQARRHVRRARESSVWVYYPGDMKLKTEFGEYDPPLFFGELTGLSGIKAPPRLSFTPYIGAQVSHFPNNIPGKSNYATSYNYGMDVKYGLNDSYTLDATLAPDFGQVRSDDQVLNLSAFEIQFEERRPFFTEGQELFEFNNLFYARRIGRRPTDYFKVANNSNYTVLNNPAQARLLNATKISGRSAEGLGIGFLNAVTANTEAKVRDTNGEIRYITTEPLSNYNIIALTQNVGVNSFIGAINTNLTKANGLGYANVTGTKFKLGTAKGTYSFEGFGAKAHVSEPGSTKDGYKYTLAFKKTSGNFKYSLSHNVESDTYDINDVGFLQAPNEITENLNLSYNVFVPKGLFLRKSISNNTNFSRTFNTKAYQSFKTSVNTYGLLRNFCSIFAFAEYNPLGDHDYFEPRGFRPYFIGPAYMGGYAGISSDYRKTVALDITGSYFFDLNRNGTYYDYSIAPIWRVNNKLQITNRYKYMIDASNYGFTAYVAPHLYFAERDVITHENTTELTYAFNPRMNLTFRGRYYWSRVEIKRILELDNMGVMHSDTTNYTENKNQNYNRFNIDFIYTWRFAPGSDLIFVWKNTTETFNRNIITAERNGVDAPLVNSFRNTLDSKQLNNFNLKILYYLDYGYFKRKRKQV